MKATNLKFIFQLLNRGLPLSLLLVIAVEFISNSRYLGLNEATLGRRALLLADATHTKWTFTMAYPILGSLLRPWTHNIFAMRCFGILMITFACLLFASSAISLLRSTQEKLIIFVILVLAGTGVYGYFPNALPEYNHLAVFCVLGMGSLVLKFNDKSPKFLWYHQGLLGILFGLFFATNILAACISFTLFSGYWYLGKKSLTSLIGIVSISLLSAFVYGLLYFAFNEPSAGVVNPGLKYNEVALQELGIYFQPDGNLRYLVLRGITFLSEIIPVGIVLWGTYLLGRTFRKPNSSMKWLFHLLPCLWLLLSAGISLGGLDARQLPGQWDFSPGFFWAKFLWYGYATTLPLLVLTAGILGSSQLIQLPKKDRTLLLFLLLVALFSCFGSGARVVHKLLLYQAYLLFILFFVLDRTPHSEREMSAYSWLVLLIIGGQTFFLQYLPIHKMGGSTRFTQSIAELPRGRGLLVQKDFAGWILDLKEKMQHLGLEPGKEVLSNDFIAVYLLGFHQAELADDANNALHAPNRHPFGLLQKELAPNLLASKLGNSALLKILGPPNLPAEIQEKEKLLETYFEKNRYTLSSSVKRGKDGMSLIYHLGHARKN